MNFRLQGDFSHPYPFSITMISAIFLGVKHGDPEMFRLEHVPRVGDTVVINASIYWVKEVRWHLYPVGQQPTNVTVYIEHIKDFR